MRRLHRLQSIAVAALALLAAACGGSGDDGSSNPPAGPPTPPSPTIATIVVSPATATLTVGQTLAFSAVARDANGAPIAGAVFAWSTSDANVASVASNGVATGIAAGSVTVKATSGGVTSSTSALRVDAAPATTVTSDELIAAALAAGTIDAETALVYRAFANFGDARLPAQYRGAPSTVFESTVMDDVLAVYDTLSADAQNKLAPFLRRPASVGSWLDPNRPQTVAAQRVVQGAGPVRLSLRPDCFGFMSRWVAVDAPTAPVRVWYDTAETGHAAYAGKVAAAIESDVWPTLFTRLGYKALLDDQSLLGCDGGNAKLDIFIVRAGSMEDLGKTFPESSPSYDRNRSAVHIRIQAGLDDTVLMHTVAHEVGHAIHWTYPTAASQPSYGWFRDAFANWAAAQVYPKNQSIINAASCVLDTPQKPIDDTGAMKCSQVTREVSRAYGAYLPLEAISWKEGPGAIQKILETTATASTAFEAMDTVLGADLRTDWNLYAQALWNQGPIVQRPDSFFVRQDIGDTPKLAPDQPNPVSANLAGKLYDDTVLDARVNNMSVKFYQFTFTEAETRSIMFFNGWRENRRKGEKVSVFALWKPEGKPWVEEDLSDYEWIGFCRDKKDERLEELVIIVSSAEWRGASPVVQAEKEPRLMRNNIGCWGFAGTTKRTYVKKSWDQGSGVVTTFTARYDYNPGGNTMTLTDSATGRLRVPVAGPLFSGGELAFHEGYGEGRCAYSATLNTSDTTILQGGSSVGSIVLNNFLEALPLDLYASQTALTGTSSRGYVANGATNRLVSGQTLGANCPSSYTTAVGPWLLTREGASATQVMPDGHLRGTWTASVPSDSFTEDYEWDLAPLREP